MTDTPTVKPTDEPYEPNRGVVALMNVLADREAYITRCENLLRRSWSVVVKSGDELLADAISDLLDRRP